MFQILQGDWIEQLKTLPNECVQCVVTSPPYYGLRDYGTAKWEGGNENCRHKSAKEPSRYDYPMQEGSRHAAIAKTTKGTDQARWKDICPDCGAIKIDSQLGLEKTPEEYVAKIVDGFREVKRVLKKDGVTFLNLGDSYWGGKGQSGSGNPWEQDKRAKLGISINKSYHQIAGDGKTRPTDGSHAVIKPKDLIGIPWRVAFALQSDGWYLRQDIIWAKPNPMPESVTDRCTKSHEYIFLLTKSARYYYNNEAVEEEVTTFENRPDGIVRDRIFDYDSKQKVLRPRTRKTGEGQDTEIETKGCAGCNGFRNKRSVWSITTQPYKEAHFATFPPEIPKICILAGSKKGDTILDPFTGSGTTGEVALKLDRNFIGIELNQKYVNDLIIPRLENINPLFRREDDYKTQSH